MIEDAKAHRFYRLYVWKWDRFARNRDHAATYRGLLKRVGIQVISVKSRWMASRRPTCFLQGVLETVAECYSADLKQKVSRAHQRRAHHRLWNGDLPFGYAKNMAGLAEIVPQEAELVRQAFERYGASTKTFQHVATWLNQTSFRPRVKRKDRQGRQYIWSKDTVRDMLRNPFYLSQTKYRGEVLPGLHEAIVSPELFERCQEMRKKRHRGPWSFTPKHRTYLLGGLL